VDKHPESTNMHNFCDLSSDLLRIILSYFNAEELTAIGSTCKLLLSLSKEESFWQVQVQQKWLIPTNTTPEVGWRKKYKHMHMRFGAVYEQYVNVQGTWLRLESWLEKNCPALLKNLNPPALEEDIIEVEKELGGVPLPADLRISLLIHNGSRGGSLALPMVSGYTLMSTKLMLSMLRAMRRSQRSKGRDLLPFAYNDQSSAFSLCIEFDKSENKACSVVMDTGFRNVLPIAKSYASWLKRAEGAISANLYEVLSDGGLDQYRLGSLSETRGIQVEVRTLFVPEQSVLLPSHGRLEQQFLFAYQVRIRNLNQKQTVQLLTRHWIIHDGEQNREEVRGSGVIGQTPVLSAGDMFQYVSACPLPTPCGTMEGSYQMIFANTGERFEANIGQFELCI